VNDRKEQYEANENKTRILIVDGSPAARRQLAQFIGHEPDLGVCIEAEGVGQALDAIGKQQVDFAIVEISSEDATSVQLTERIKLQCPNLPVLALSLPDELLYAGRAINRGAAEQITTAIHYIQSLLKSRVFGFTVFVKVERNLAYAHEKP
jgi:DNA-binding NarL/FixJ family response regulator